MRIQVTDVLFDEETKRIMVEFSTPFGDCVGEWRYTQPELYSHHYVEIETDNRLTWGQDIYPAEDDQFIVRYDVEYLVTLQGKLEEVEPDGVVYLRIGSGLATIKTNGTPPPLDTFVKAHPAKINLFPYDNLETGV
jgi:hypothetical protein